MTERKKEEVMGTFDPKFILCPTDFSESGKLFCEDCYMDDFGIKSI